MSMTMEEMRDVAEQCEFSEMMFGVIQDGIDSRPYLQGSYMEEDTETGDLAEQRTRKWMLSEFMTKSELVQTCFACCMASMEHRAREWFLYRGKAIFQPHYDVDALWDINQSRDIR